MTARNWPQAETIFNAALDLPPGVRTSWVVASCPGDPALAELVLRMLAADAAPGDEIRRAVRTAVNQWLTR